MTMNGQNGQTAEPGQPPQPGEKLHIKDGELTREEVLELTLLRERVVGSGIAVTLARTTLGHAQEKESDARVALEKFETRLAQTVLARRAPPPAPPDSPAPPTPLDAVPVVMRNRAARRRDESSAKRARA